MLSVRNANRVKSKPHHWRENSGSSPESPIGSDSQSAEQCSGQERLFWNRPEPKVSIKQARLWTRFWSEISFAVWPLNRNRNSSSILTRHLPDNQKDVSFVDANILSAQFDQALSALDDVIYSRECANVFRSFGIYDEEIFRTSADRELISDWSIRQNDA